MIELITKILVGVLSLIATIVPGIAIATERQLAIVLGLPMLAASFVLAFILIGMYERRYRPRRSRREPT